MSGLYFLLLVCNRLTQKKGQMEIRHLLYVLIVMKSARVIDSAFQCTVLIGICKDILFTSPRFCDEFCHFFLQLLDCFLLRTRHGVMM